MTLVTENANGKPPSSRRRAALVARSFSVDLADLPEEPVAPNFDDSDQLDPELANERGRPPQEEAYRRKEEQKGRSCPRPVRHPTPTHAGERIFL